MKHNNIRVAHEHVVAPRHAPSHCFINEQYYFLVIVITKMKDASVMLEIGMIEHLWDVFVTRVCRLVGHDDNKIGNISLLNVMQPVGKHLQKAWFVISTTTTEAGKNKMSMHIDTSDKPSRGQVYWIKWKLHSYDECGGEAIRREEGTRHQTLIPSKQMEKRDVNKVKMPRSETRTNKKEC